MPTRHRILALLLAALPLQLLVPGLHCEAAQAGEAPKGALPLLSVINEARRLAGLTEVVPDLALSAGCEAHSRYLLLNRDSPLVMGLDVHTENPELPGYSESGLLAANQSLIAIGASPEAAASRWLGGVYHRTPLLRENLKAIGVGIRAEYVIVDAHGGLDGEAQDVAIQYPTPQQTDVPTHAQRELPSPLPAGAQAAGYPVTLQFREEAAVTRVAATLRNASGTIVPTFNSDPERPASAFPQGNVIAMIPTGPLQAGAVYTASVACVVDGVRRSTKWSFTTRAGKADSAQRALSLR